MTGGLIFSAGRVIAPARIGHSGPSRDPAAPETTGTRESNPDADAAGSRATPDHVAGNA